MLTHQKYLKKLHQLLEASQDNKKDISQVLQQANLCLKKSHLLQTVQKHNQQLVQHTKHQ